METYRKRKLLKFFLGTCVLFSMIFILPMVTVSLQYGSLQNQLYNILSVTFYAVLLVCTISIPTFTMAISASTEDKLERATSHFKQTCKKLEDKRLKTKAAERLKQEKLKIEENIQELREKINEKKNDSHHLTQHQSVKNIYVALECV